MLTPRLPGGWDARLADDRLLAIYLNDHLGGSAAGRDRCRHAARRYRGSALGAFLAGLLAEIEEDRATLLRLIGRVGARPSKVKQALGVAAERVGRLKPNGTLGGHSPLTPFIELEALSLGVEGKRLLWEGLGGLADPRLSEFDFVELAERATAQRVGIERHRLAAGRNAFG
ncbi:MAG TPA: hypothetical protein VF061_00170 [Gemmatimonadales bacterium]